MDNTLNTNKINPEYLGSILINGIYYDKKTAKFLALKDFDNCEHKNEDINEDITEDVTESFYVRFLNLFKSKQI
jgi:hypothetical protein